MATYAARPVTVDDLEALSAIDASYAERFGLETSVTQASLNFYARSGHAFTLCEGQTPVAFILAHAIWTGARPLVLVSRIASSSDNQAECELLLEAVTKSAYDAAVYDLQVLLPDADHTARAALQAKAYRPKPLSVFARTLGSRGADERT